MPWLELYRIHENLKWKYISGWISAQTQQDSAGGGEYPGKVF